MIYLVCGEDDITPCFASPRFTFAHLLYDLLVLVDIKDRNYNMSSTKVDVDPLDRSDFNDSFRTCEDDQAAENINTVPKNDVTRSVVSFSPSTRRLTEETLPTVNCSILVSSRGPDDSDDSNIKFDENNVNNENEAGAAMHFSDEKEELIPDDDEDNSLLEDDEEDDLPEDSFSMLFVARWDRENLRVSLWEYFLPFCVFGVQMVIMILLMINLLQTSDRQLLTPMNVPVEVPTTVKISQYIACKLPIYCMCTSYANNNSFQCSTLFCSYTISTS